MSKASSTGLDTFNKVSCCSLLLTGRLPTENTYPPSPAISLLAHSNKKKKIGIKMCCFIISPGSAIRSQVGYNLGVSIGISTFQRINGLKEPQAFQNTNCMRKNPDSSHSSQLCTIRPLSCTSPSPPTFPFWLESPKPHSRLLSISRTLSLCIYSTLLTIQHSANVTSSKGPSLGILTKVIPPSPGSRVILSFPSLVTI